MSRDDIPATEHPVEIESALKGTKEQAPSRLSQAAREAERERMAHRIASRGERTHSLETGWDSGSEVEQLAIRSSDKSHSSADPAEDEEENVEEAPRRDEEEEESDAESGDDSDPSTSPPSSSYTMRGREYTLALVSVPVQCTTSGAGLCEPPLIAELSVRHGGGASSGRTSRGEEFVAEDDIPYLVANVSLWDATGGHRVVPASTATTTGSTGSLEPVHATSSTLRGPLSTSGSLFRASRGRERLFFLFPDLQITRAGSWKLAVSLIGTWPPSTSSTSGGIQEGAGQMTVVVAVKADSVTMAVPEESPLAVGSAQVDPRTAALLISLRQQGADLDGSEESSPDGSQPGR